MDGPFGDARILLIVVIRDDRHKAVHAGRFFVEAQHPFICDSTSGTLRRHHHTATTSRTVVVVQVRNPDGLLAHPGLVGVRGD